LHSIADGVYAGVISQAELIERESKYSSDGFRVVLRLQVEIEDEDGETVSLFSNANVSWSKKATMVKLLEDLKFLPAPGEGLQLRDLVGLGVQAMIENVERDGTTFSNIVSLKQSGSKRTSGIQFAPPQRRAPVKKVSAVVEQDEEQDFIDDED